MVPEIETRQLANFLAVAETGSFRGAATALSVGQSSVSRQIQRLEDVVGVSLFERKADGARLTTAGRCFATRARRIVDDLKTAHESALSAGLGRTGYLTVGLIASLSRGPLREIVSAFRGEQPEVELLLIESNRSDLLSQLSHRQVDIIAAAGQPHSNVGDGLVISHDGVFLAVASDMALASKSRLSWQDIKDASFVVSSCEPGPEIYDYIVRKIGRVGRSIAVRRHLMGREGIMTLVGLGMGVSLVAESWRGVRYPNVSFVPIGDEGDRVPFSVTWLPENDNPALRRFISLARIEAKRKGALS
ncbi:LysR family transcriptional regulator [Sulfitobacter sp. D35]|uniref:LysR family transcriptional regulator n=1 Tax=Sulfitobacter sp. D35 TaxID=3083252 RepID=UPI00296EB87E|nr:LysR family transcriptional regulator [Sulfitobacter sp. D35]MDW4497887.1 LysR family transcriptional regulator [Sulfitobacter sp. D35]